MRPLVSSLPVKLYTPALYTVAWTDVIGTTERVLNRGGFLTTEVDYSKVGTASLMQNVPIPILLRHPYIGSRVESPNVDTFGTLRVSKRCPDCAV